MTTNHSPLAGAVVSLRLYQNSALNKARTVMAAGNRRVLLYSPTGCHAPGTKVMRADGTLSNVEDVRPGDNLMGPDSKPRRVLALHQGIDEMFRIVPTKGEPFIVNGDHILSVRVTNDGSKQAGATENVTVREWLAASPTYRHTRKLYRVAIEFESVPVPLDPYMLGVMLGDGALADGAVITNPEAEIRAEVGKLAAAVGCDVTDYDTGDRCPTFSVVTERGKPNPVRDQLRRLGLLGCRSGDKFIPGPYLRNSRAVRLDMLAGILDTDGYLGNGSYDYISKSWWLAHDVAYLARSLGFAAYAQPCSKGCQGGFVGEYFRVSISGELSLIPCRVPRKQAQPRRQKKDVLVTGFAVEPVGTGRYFGFECDGDNLYLLGDFTVTHNSGKTTMAEAMIRGAVAKGGRVLFVANRTQLIAQASAHLTRAGIAHGILQSSNTRDLHEKVLVASIDTIAVRGVPDDVSLFVIDEAHSVAGSKKYRDLLAKYNRVPVVGLSATPFSPGLGAHDDRLKGALFQELVVAASIRDLIDQKYLVDCDAYAPVEPDLTGVKSQRGIGGELDYNERELAEACDKPSLTGDIVAHWLKHAAGKPTVVFACNIPHSQHIVEAFEKAGVTAAHIDYHHTDEERAAILDGFNQGRFTVLSNSALLAEGWDAPHAEVMILARPTRSLIRYIQMAGRVLRPFPGKERALILDHSGTVLRLGFPTDDLPLELDDGKASTSNTRKQERKKSEPKPCPSCKFVRPAGVHQCPKCGFAPARQSDVEVRDGELQRLTRKKNAATRFEKAATYAGLLQIAHERRYSEKWAAHQFRKIFGVWPRALPEVRREPSAELRSWVKSEQIRFAKGQQKAREGRNHV